MTSAFPLPLTGFFAPVLERDSPPGSGEEESLLLSVGLGGAASFVFAAGLRTLVAKAALALTATGLFLTVRFFATETLR